MNLKDLEPTPESPDDNENNQNHHILIENNHSDGNLLFPGKQYIDQKKT